MENSRQYITSDQAPGCVAAVHPCTSCGSIFKKDSSSLQNDPIPPPPDSVPLLHRWNSDPIPLSTPATLPPCWNNLERTVSDRSQAYTLFPPAFAGPSSYPDQTTKECSDLNKVMKMKKQMREMLKMCHKVVNFSQEDEMETKNQKGQDTEAVTVEREEDSMNVSFKCQCGKSYQILVIGDKCYYKI